LTSITFLALMFKGRRGGAQIDGVLRRSRSRDDTLEIGREIGSELRGGELVLLHGPLGAGKSVVARGIGEALRAPGWRGSPTFNLVHEYDTVPALYHADLYRLSQVEAEDLGLDEYLRPHSVLVVEWPEKAPDLLADLVASVRIDVDLETLGQDERTIRVTSSDGRRGPR
jgi:tRNA threonylcarbamoyladenosine biosynthesis protein TsaE